MVVENRAANILDKFGQSDVRGMAVCGGNECGGAGGIERVSREPTAVWQEGKMRRKESTCVVGWSGALDERAA